MRPSSAVRMRIRIDAHHATEPDARRWPTPVQIEAPWIGIDLDCHPVLGAGLQQLLMSTSQPRRRRSCRPVMWPSPSIGARTIGGSRRATRAVAISTSNCGTCAAPTLGMSLSMHLPTNGPGTTLPIHRNLNADRTLNERQYKREGDVRWVSSPKI